MRKFIAGNWKMNGSQEMALGLMRDIARGLRGNPKLAEYCDFSVFPPALYLNSVRPLCEESRILLGAQDCSPIESGAFTGDISASMIRDCGGKYVILGHSERRQYHGEDSTHISKKVAAAHRAGLTTIICIGETEREREEGKAEQVVGNQLLESMAPSCTSQDTIIAYEPVWAIGTGKTATPQDVHAMHGFIRNKLLRRQADFKNMKILYGGSVKPENAPEIMNIENVNGALIGGASLRADQFLGIALSAVKD
jgi:triosephosphate isomerase